jgi:hypothetical protein
MADMNMDKAPEGDPSQAPVPPSGQDPVSPQTPGETPEGIAATDTAGEDRSRSPQAVEDSPRKPARWHKWAIIGGIVAALAIGLVIGLVSNSDETEQKANAAGAVAVGAGVAASGANQTATSANQTATSAQNSSSQSAASAEQSQKEAEKAASSAEQQAKQTSNEVKGLENQINEIGKALSQGANDAAKKSEEKASGLASSIDSQLTSLQGTLGQASKAGPPTSTQSQEAPASP